MNNLYGCLPPVKDVRDYRLKKAAGATKLPSVFTLSILPRVKDQGSVRSCVAHASSSILEYHAIHEGKEAKLSTAFIYGIQKDLCGRTESGMYLRDACKIVNTYGDMYEEDCEGNVEVPSAHKLAEDSLADIDKLTKASEFKIASYFKLKNNNDIKRAIMNYGPVLASVKWYDTFHLDSNDRLVGEQSGDYGYHAIMLYGWCPEGFVAQNSWGKNWGSGGSFVIPNEIAIREAWQWIDAEDGQIVKPVRNTFMDFVYKIVNYIINLFNKD